MWNQDEKLIYLILPFHLPSSTLKLAPFPTQLCLQAVDNPAGQFQRWGYKPSSLGSEVWKQNMCPYLSSSNFALCEWTAGCLTSFCRDMGNPVLVSNRYKSILSQDKEKIINNEEHVANFKISLSQSSCHTGLLTGPTFAGSGKPTVNKDFQKLGKYKPNGIKKHLVRINKKVIILQLSGWTQWVFSYRALSSETVQLHKPGNLAQGSWASAEV